MSESGRVGSTWLSGNEIICVNVKMWLDAGASLKSNGRVITLLCNTVIKIMCRREITTMVGGGEKSASCHLCEHMGVEGAFRICRATRKKI